MQHQNAKFLYMSGNISHFQKLQMNDPITALMAKTEDNDDSMSLSFDLMTKASFTDRVHTDE